MTKVLIYFALISSITFAGTHTIQKGSVNGNVNGVRAETNSRIPAFITSQIQAANDDIEAVETLLKNYKDIRNPSQYELEQQVRFQIVLTHIQAKKKLLDRASDMYVSGKDIVKESARQVKRITADVKSFTEKDEPVASFASSRTLPGLAMERAKLQAEMKRIEADINELLK